MSTSQKIPRRAPIQTSVDLASLSDLAAIAYPGEWRRRQIISAQHAEALARQKLAELELAKAQQRQAGQRSQTPNDLIPTPVAIKDFAVSRRTLARRVKDGTLHDYRPEGAKDNVAMLFSKAELARHFQRQR